MRPVRFSRVFSVVDPAARWVLALWLHCKEAFRTSAERIEFIDWIAANPEAGAVIPGSAGCRKVRWATSGQGKRGGARVIYFLHADGTVWLLIVYKKSKFDKLPTSFITQLRKAVQDAL